MRSIWSYMTDNSMTFTRRHKSETLFTVLDFMVILQRKARGSPYNNNLAGRFCYFTTATVFIYQKNMAGKVQTKAPIQYQYSIFNQYRSDIPKPKKTIVDFISVSIPTIFVEGKTVQRKKHTHVIFMMLRKKNYSIKLSMDINFLKKTPAPHVLP